MDIRIDAGMAAAARPGLVVMLKAPANAKRRLAAEVGALAEGAAAHLLACALEDALAWPGPTWLSPAEPSDRDWLLAMMGAAAQAPPLALRGWPCELIAQRSGSLGERINHVDRELRGRGVDSLLFIGADCPGLDPAYLDQAAGALEQADAVLGPAGDGGVVLMGARRPWPALGGLAWSGRTLGAELHALCRAAGWRVATLEARADIDTLQDLLDSDAELAADRRASRCSLAAWLKAHRGALRAPGRAAETRRGTAS